MKRWLCATSLGLVLAGCDHQREPAKAPVKQVEVIEITPRPLRIDTELAGRVAPVRIAEVRARVPGIVMKRAFEEGADVKAGQLLFDIDPAPFKAALSRAEGELAKIEAEHVEAESVVRRYQPLVEKEAVSRQEFDAAVAKHKSALAAKQVAQANVETARLNLDYTAVRAPISGRIGRALVTEGALVGQADATHMATIQQLDPVYVDFTQSVDELIQTREALAAGRLAKRADGGAAIQATIDGSKLIREGSLLFSDVGVDQTTNQVTLRGRFRNADHLMLPGMYVRVTSALGENPNAILVPQRAISRSTDGKPQVFIVSPEGVVQIRPVDTGAMHGSEWHIRHGLAAGEKVIVGGTHGLQPNDKVTTRVAGKTASATNPTSN
jgi:multidrug efflux system membrane fusion protein